MFVVGFGANHPLYSNADPAGQAANRRVELVIYPDRAGG
jgi:outer membrane protein OmpA-like peptidoglycan-associated protein